MTHNDGNYLLDSEKKLQKYIYFWYDFLKKKNYIYNSKFIKTYPSYNIFLLYPQLIQDILYDYVTIALINPIYN